MKIKEIKTMKYIGLFLVGAMLLTSCFDDPGTDIVLEESFVELDAARTVTQSAPFSYLRRNDGINLPSGILVNRVSTSSSNAVNVTIAVDPASTAIEGLHYVVNSTSVTIPAGEFSVEVDIDIIPDNIEAGEQLNLILEIVSADLPINQTVAKATHVLSVICPVDPTFATGDYLIEQVSPFIPGSGPSLSDGSVVTVTQEGTDETARVFNTFNFPNFCRTANPFRFNLVCGRTVSQANNGNCSCNGNYVFNEATVNETFDESDDSTFLLTFTDDATNDCGAPVQTTYRFTKQ